ncbi:alkaline phosphatase family protein [Capillimicrobium parvum]|uniref:Phosphodiesterase n=1 Tax=Capillimicrobium parvum TaxID=2884022 RepID=A0A9E6XY13_9ACTN|nr:alkaline phosphatase family protein [Capillimicrobium parvum]UGS36423.1 hypothetical protein DSM104329_02827 [Capillimicrobium parvum]
MPRALLLGIDGATFDVLDPLMRDGTMPFLARLVDDGVRAPLMSTALPLTAQAWPSLMTGRSPGHHGLIDFVRFQPAPAGGGTFRFTTSRDLASETVWTRAARQGRTATALNFFGLYPPLPIDGHSIGAFIPWRHLKDAVHPPELYRRLQDLPGFAKRELAMDHELEKKCLQGLAEGETRGWIELHTRRERQWLTILRHLLTTEPSDVVAVVFDGTDKLQHACWRFIDPRLQPVDPTPDEREIRALCLDYFRQLDAILAEVVSLAGPDARTFVVSDHGFGPTNEVFYVNTWLERQGLLTWAPGAAQDRGDRLSEDRVRSLVELVDWDATRAFAVTPSSNGIYLAAGSEHLAPMIAERLLAFRDPVSGGQVVTEVRRREDAYPGPCADRAPHLLLTLRDSGFVSVLPAAAPLVPRATVAGTHRPEGIFAACGPGIARGISVPPLSILDVAPLLLHSLGLPVDDDLEGRVPTEIFAPGVLGREPVRAGAPFAAPHVVAGDGDDGALPGQELVEDRLRALGYFE